MHNNTEHIAGHVLALASIGGWLVGWLPTIATTLAIIWYGVLLWDRFMTKKEQDDG